MQYITTPMWSVPLFKTNIGKPDPITMAWIKNQHFPLEATAHDHTANKYILNEPKLKKLKAQIKECSDFFVHTELGIHDDLDFILENSWINRHRPGEHSPMHWHSNAMLSGVYYIQNEEDAGEIYFKKAHGYHNLFPDVINVDFKTEIGNQYNLETFALQPESGDLIIFPSHVEHMVTQNITHSERFSLAFNLFARGTLGGGTSQVKI
jgi:uncharacterized protein (TIGR02466 family)|tara:strand:- start:234 stop:857 length:624 start_codon:yes stop_codon:yes gene_type:complete